MSEGLCQGRGFKWYRASYHKTELNFTVQLNMVQVMNVLSSWWPEDVVTCTFLFIAQHKLRLGYELIFTVAQPCQCLII